MLVFVENGADFLQSRVTRFPGADSDRIGDVGNEDLAVADLVGVGSLLDRIDSAFNGRVCEHDFDFQLGQEIDHIFGAAIEFGVAALAADRALLWLDVWATDRVGHAADPEAARSLIRRIDAFVAGVLTHRPDDVTVVLCSDHGNLEDLRHGRHTRAPVPLAAVGPEAARFGDARSILALAPAVRAAWDAQQAD